MRSRHIVLGLAVLVLASGANVVWGAARRPGRRARSAPTADVISTGTLLEQMTDLSRLAELPVPAYTTKQFSSYDRASKTPDDPKTWFANADWGQFLRVEDNAGRKEHVMMDADGPGAIVRIWSANPKGTIRIYLDGSEAPAIETPMTDLLGGKYKNLARPIAGEYSKGWNLYFPISYAKHCKVTSDQGDFYYHVNCRTYPSGTQVKTFTAEELSTLEARIENVIKLLEGPRNASIPPSQRTGTKIDFDVTVAPGEEAALAKLDGPQAICSFKTTLAAANTANAAAETVLSMTFDGEQTVASPLGDFFGTAPGLIAYESLPLGISEEKPPQLWSHWVMPFEKAAQITVKNLGDQPVTLKGTAACVRWWWTERSLLFHAKWRIQRDLPGRPHTDWTHLRAEGQGRFVGGALHVINSVRDWWGEGDEKIYVDGEKFPSHFGTGSEDYYGYAWCFPERFVHAYHNQPYCQGPGNYGNTSVNRFHILDDIPFTTAFKFDMENWHGSDRPAAKTTRAAVSYWYARPGGSDFFKPLSKADVAFIEVPAFQPRRVKGAIEGENLKVLQKTGVAEKQELGGDYSDGAQLWWREGQPGDKLVLAFDSPQAGPRHVIVRLTKAADYAQVQLYVNDRKAGNTIDLYHDGVVPTDELDLGEFTLTQGQNTLTAEIVGANEKAVKKHMFGLDYVLLR